MQAVSQAGFRGQMLGRALLLAMVVGPFAATGSTTIVYHASDAILFNPERGFFQQASLRTNTYFEGVRTNGNSLCYANITLDEFRGTNIPPERVEEIDQAFATMRDAGIKGIVRINYNEGTNAFGLGEDTSLHWMTNHLERLKPVLMKNVDVIAFFQAGMIGAWGEWHSSASGLHTPQDRRAVWDLLLANLPPDRFIQVRTPGFVNELENLGNDPIDTTTAFNNTPRARIAHHNDCWLADETDKNTYPEAELEALKDQIRHDTRYAPWGGETCLVPPTNLTYLMRCDNATNEAIRFRATFLNGTFNSSVISNLQMEFCWEDFERHLGYRFELVSATLPESLAAGAEFPFTVRIRNTGWAPIYNARPVFLRVLAGTAVVQDIPLETDPRRWLLDGATNVITGVGVAACDVSTNHLGFALWMPDPAESLRTNPDYSVRCANSNVWDAVAGHNLLMKPAEQPRGVVRIDGDFSDWAGVPSAATDPTGEFIGAGADFEEIWMTSDARYLYLRIRCTNEVDWSSPLISLYVDANNNPSNGWPVSSAVGSELLIQGNTANLQETGAFTNGASPLALGITRAPTGTVREVEMRFSRTATYPDGSPLFGEAIRIQWISEAVVSTNRLVQDEFPDDRSGIHHAFPPNTGLPTVGAIRRASAPRAIRLEGTAPPASVLGVYASPDLAIWSLLGHCLSDPAGNVLYVDDPPTDSRQRSYSFSN